ncbi:hypothetical protein BASA81_007972 [Batrachochytrium salamandrivorans]|nr:hypothetical protein BASA81_007972 [Batrachochytrium salamandrivorans]
MLWRRALSTNRGGGAILGRPFKLSKEQALQSFDDWENQFLPAVLRTISRRNLTIQPILVPFYGNPQTNQVVYGGASGYPFSDLLVTGAKTDLDTWSKFDHQQSLRMKDISVISKWCPNPWEGEEVKQAYLPAYLVKFLHTSTSASSAVVGAETGKVSGLREHTVSSAKQEFQRYLPTQSNLVFLFPPLLVTMLFYAYVRVKYSHRMVLALSQRGGTKYNKLLAGEFGQLNNPLSEAERQAFKQEREEQAYRQQNARSQRQQRLRDMMEKPDDALETLGLQRGASQEEIHAAYRKQLLRYHPDHFQGGSEDEATKKTQKIIKAYRQLQTSK